MTEFYIENKTGVLRRCSDILAYLIDYGKLIIRGERI